jgi:hypothetical protein
MFTKDSRTENFLTSMGVAFKYSNSVAFSDMAKGWSETNLARPVAKREEAIIEYATLMESGSAAPAPILHGMEHGYDVLDGVQRLAAAELAGYTKLSAYVVECDSDDVLTAIRVLANARLQGRPEPPEWTRRRAVEILVVQKGLSVAEVAKMGGWRPADVEKTSRALDWGFKIRCIGGPQEMSDAMIETISKHTTQEELVREPTLIAEFLTTIKQAQFSASDAEAFVEEFFQPISKASKIHQVYKERLETFKQDPEVVTRTLGRRGTTMRQDVNLRRLLRAAGTVLDEIAESGAPVPYVDEFFRLLNTLEDKLHRVAKNHKQPVKTAIPADRWAKV